MRDRFSGLAVRLVIVVLVVGLLGGLVGSLVIRRATRAALLSEVEDEHLGVAERLAAVLDARMIGLEQNLRMLATREPITVLDPGGAELAVALRAGESFDSLLLYGVDGTPVAGAANAELVVPSALPARPEIFTDLTPATTKARTTDEQPAAIELVAPVERPPGQIVGALVAKAPLEIVAQGMQAGFLGTTAIALVTDIHGRILAHPQRDLVVRREAYPVAGLQAGKRVDTFSRGGTEVLAALAETTEVPAYVIVQQEESEALGGVGNRLGEITVLLGLVVLLIVIAVLALGTRQLRPLQDLARTVRRIGHGEPARAEVKGTLEVRVVAEEINRMAAALERRVHDLEEAQRVLARTEARFRTAFSQGPVAMAITGRDGFYEQVNPAMCALLGRSAEEFSGLTWRDITHPDDLPESDEAREVALASEERSYELEKRYLHADGHSIWVRLSVGIVEPGNPASTMVAHFQDVTQQRLADEERDSLLRSALAAEDRTMRVMEAAPDATIVVDASGKIMYANRRTAEMFGYTPSELVGRHVEMLLPERFRERHEAHRTSFVENARARSMGAGLALWGRRKDAGEFPVEVSLSPLEIDGKTQVVASVRDVTERHRADETSRTLDSMRSRQRQAVELNDNIVQGLAVAKWAFECQRLEEARRAVERTYQAAQALIQDMLREASAVDIAPGDLVRQTPAEFLP